MGKGTLVNSDNMQWLNKWPLKECFLKFRKRGNLRKPRKRGNSSGNLGSAGTFRKLRKPWNASVFSETLVGHLVGILTIHSSNTTMYKWVYMYSWLRLYIIEYAHSCRAHHIYHDVREINLYFITLMDCKKILQCITRFLHVIIVVFPPLLWTHPQRVAVVVRSLSPSRPGGSHLHGDGDCHTPLTRLRCLVCGVRQRAQRLVDC